MKRGSIDGVVNLEAIPSFMRPEMPEILSRVRSAGAEGPLDFVGAGMFGAVLCDSDGHAWKVARFGETPSEKHVKWMHEQLEGEYEWLRDAENSTISDLVARVFSFHSDEIVLERECVFGRPGAWADRVIQ